MTVQNAPPAMVSATGSTPEGMPLSHNRAPKECLQPWIARLGVTAVALPQGQSIACGAFTEFPLIRVIYGAPWTAATASGLKTFEPGEKGLALYFGPYTKRMDLTAHGSFKVVSINFAPGGTRDLRLPDPGTVTDEVMLLDSAIGEKVPVPDLAPDDDAITWIGSVEDHLAAEFARIGPPRPPSIVQDFESLCLTDPGASLDDFADAHRITRRTLERVIGREFGVSPRFATRRARALDIAAALLNIAMEDEEAELHLRYFDQSHLTREMHQFFGTTPGRLKKGPNPLLRINLEIRQSRRLEMLERLGCDEPRPWRDPEAEPR